MAPLPLPSPLDVTINRDDPALGQFNVPVAKWLETYRASNPVQHLDAIGSAVVVFDPQDRILLLQRAGHDSMPNLWEVPGGGVDDEDETILQGAARELWEEAGLLATSINAFIPERDSDTGVVGRVFSSRSGKHLCCLAFEAEVAEGDHDKVRIDPDEHQAFVWVTEEEAKAGRAGGLDIPFTHGGTQRLVLKAFELRRAAKGRGGGEMEDED